MKVFIDSNVWIAAYTGSELCMETTLYIEQLHEAVISTQVLEEYSRVMKRKMKVEPALVEFWVSQITRISVVLPEPKNCPCHCRDPKDDPIIQAALDGGCEWIVTGDADLLSLKRIKKIPITTPRDFMEALGVEEVV